MSGSRAIDKAQSYESVVRGMYGDTPSAERQYTALVDGQSVGQYEAMDGKLRPCRRSNPSPPEKY